MDARTTLYVPGTPPPELAGRHDVLERAEIALTHIQHQRPSKSLIVVGLRGVGKTVLLVRFHTQATKLGWSGGTCRCGRPDCWPTRNRQIGRNWIKLQPWISNANS